MPTPPIDPTDLTARLLAVERAQESLKNLVFRHGYRLYGEDWHIVGAAGEPAFQNGWGATADGPVRFFKDSLGIVHLGGRLWHGGTNSVAGSNPAFTLPPGYGADVAFNGYMYLPTMIGFAAGGAGAAGVLGVKSNSNSPGGLVGPIAACNLVELEGLAFRAPRPH